MSLESVKETILNFVLLIHVTLAQHVIELTIANTYFGDDETSDYRVLYVFHPEMSHFIIVIIRQTYFSLLNALHKWQHKRLLLKLDGFSFQE